MPRAPDHRDRTHTPGCRALILCCLAVAAIATAAAQGARGADVSDARSGAPGGLSDTRSAEQTLGAFRTAYAEMGRPRMEVKMDRSDSRESPSLSPSGSVAEEKGSSRDVERAVTRVLRLGGAILEDPRAQNHKRSSDAGSQSAPDPQASNNLVVEVQFEGRDPCSVRLRVIRRSDGRQLAASEAQGTNVRAAESATLMLLKQLADAR
jgi:hypothetical protein